MQPFVKLLNIKQEKFTFLISYHDVLGNELVKCTIHKNTAEKSQVLLHSTSCFILCWKLSSLRLQKGKERQDTILWCSNSQLQNYNDFRPGERQSQDFWPSWK